MKVITYATKKDQYYGSLEDSCKKFDYQLVTLGLNTKWNGMSDKIKGVNNYLDGIDDDEVVLVVDAYDVIACRNSSELLDEYINNFDDTKVVFNAERLPNSYILTWSWERIYSSKRIGDTKYNKLNAGVLIARAKVLRDFYTMLIDENELGVRHIKSDQKLIYDMMETDQRNIDIDIDKDCKLFNTFGLYDDILVKDNMIFNNHTKTYPFFIHGPGKQTSMDRYIKEMGVKLDFTRDPPDLFDRYYINKNYINIDILALFVIVGIVILLVLLWKAYIRPTR